MRLTERFVRAYFDSVYNIAYDFTTARLRRFQKLQASCVGRLTLEDDDQVLCVGLGTGNEIQHILTKNREVAVTGIDYSKTALKKAVRKAISTGRSISLHLMDARQLDFASGTFDSVVCIHVMDFLGDARDQEKATAEIMRVLKKGGEFVITYPSGKEQKLGKSLLKDAFRGYISEGKHPFVAFWKLAVQVITALVYLPLLSRTKKSFYSKRKLGAMLGQMEGVDFQIEEYPVYQDLIAHGRKSDQGGD
ncbi:MAG: class I SAM-dependent methyltransferase [Dehalococcoidales bacterium]